MTIILWASRLVLLLLVCLSIWGWSIVIEKRRLFKKLQSLESLDKLKSMVAQNNYAGLEQGSGGPLTGILQSAISAPQKNRESITSMVNSFVLMEKQKLELGLPVLGTLGSTTPFVGLLGTIMGIIVSFGQLSMGQGDMNAVMYSLAEALILTAAGLMVAIPSVVAFNIFTRRLRSIFIEGEALVNFYLAHVNSSHEEK